jgi:DNA-binding transcriptional MocR family regulator
MYLADHLSGVELKIAVMMASMTEFGTNSLAPLDNNISYELLADKFSISKSTVKKAFDNLFEVGVYASFKYCHFERGPVEEWVFNPFISFRGKLIDSDLKNLFLNTRVAKHFLRQ